MTTRQCQLNSMPELRGGRELTTREAPKLFGSGQSWLSDLSGMVPVNVNSYHGGRSCAAGCLTQATPSAWWWMKEAAAKSWRRDLQMTVSSLVFGADEQDDYFCPRSILHREGAGRSWAMNNTSNVSGV
jgi:hypothetical protein